MILHELRKTLEHTSAASRHVEVDNGAGNASGEVLAGGAIGDESSICAGAAASIAEDGELVDGRTRREASTAGGSGEDGGNGSDGELHIEGWLVVELGSLGRVNVENVGSDCKEELTVAR